MLERRGPARSLVAVLVSGLVTYDTEFAGYTGVRPSYLTVSVRSEFTANKSLPGRFDVKLFSLQQAWPRSHEVTVMRLYLLQDYEGAISVVNSGLGVGPEIKHSQYFWA